MTTSEVLMTAMMGIVTVVIAAGIPWAYTIGNKITRIESKLSNGISERIERHSDSLSDMDQRVSTIEQVLADGGKFDHVRRVLEERAKRRSKSEGQQ